MFSKLHDPGPLGPGGHFHTIFGNGRFQGAQRSFGCDVRGRCCCPGRRQITKHLDQSAMEPEIVLSLGWLSVPLELRHCWDSLKHSKNLLSKSLLASSHKLAIKTVEIYIFSNYLLGRKLSSPLKSESEKVILTLPRRALVRNLLPEFTPPAYKVG